MGSTQIFNKTSKPLEMKVNNHRYFTKIATVDTNKSYTVHISYDNSYVEYFLGANDGAGKDSVIVNSDECVDNKSIVVRERNGKYDVEMEPRISSSSSDTAGGNEQRSTKKPRWKIGALNCLHID